MRKNKIVVSVKLFLILAILFALIIAPTACRTAMPKNRAPSSPNVVTLKSQFMTVEVGKEDFSFRVLDNSGKILFENAGDIKFTTVRGQRAREYVAWYAISPGKAEPWKELYDLKNVSSDQANIVVSLASKNGGPERAQMTVSFPSPKALRVEFKIVNDPGVNRVAFRFKINPDDRYYGMGERYNSAEHRGEFMRVWSEEGANALYNLSKYLPDLTWNPFPHGVDSTYFPMPYFLNPVGYGFLLDDTHYSTFDFGNTNSNVLEITNWNSEFNFDIFYGPKPLDVIEEMTAKTGRVTVSQPWVFAPWGASVGGSALVREVAATVRREHIPTSAIWSEDWWWRVEWELQRGRYPDYEKLARELHDDGIRFLGYFQPYISVKTEAFQNGAEHGYFTMNSSGKPYVLDVTLAKKAQLDLTNPEANEWWKQSFFQKALDYGIDGWMHDFGEYTPPDSVSFDGRDGWAVHNEYPVLWAKLAREFFDKARPDGDWVFFIRGGYTGVQKYAPVMWTGDSNTNFERFDGLPSTIPAATSVGISGFPITATDIAGYQCLTARPANKELFIRWTELGAMLPVMRNHIGYIACNNWRFDGDRETLDAYKKYAILHTALFPYFYTLAYEAAARGWPVVRHMMLQYPDDPKAASLEYQFMVGDRLLVAPVLKKGATDRELYLPEGDWYDYFTGERFTGPGMVKVSAPLDKLPLFVKAGAILPVFDSEIDTLVKEKRADLKGWDDANASMKIMFFGVGRDELKLWDGTRIVCAAEQAGRGKCEISGAPVERKYSFDWR